MSTTVNQALLDRNVSDVYEQGIEVVCAWPVSGQYGPGSRILYYVLIAACVLARKAEWIKNACLAAALLFPAVAALHGIALAAFHRDGAVDLDIYGAFQLCAIGILAAPVTVRLSRTYFNDPGRNAIFLWAGLILAGLLGLTVEFYRAVPTTCYMDDQGRALSGDPHDFPYDAQPACNMTCNTSPAGPQSPMRGGAANNIYLIPAPSKLSFGTGTLLCATCCVHAILWLASMMDKILEINWKSRFGINDDIRSEPIKGTNGATVGKMNDVNEIIRFFISVAIVPIFTAAGLAVLIVGEINFFSYQMRYQNEPMASIGQWGPIVGTGIAIVGSLYLLLAADIEAALHGPSDNEKGCEHECPKHSSHAPTEEQILPPSHSLDETDTVDETLRSFSRDKGGRLKGKINGLSVTGNSKTTSAHGLSGSRRKAADALIAWSGLLGQVTHDSFDLSKFRDGAALDFPEIPGEKERNRNLAHVKELYSKRLQADGTPARPPITMACTPSTPIAFSSTLVVSSTSKYAAGRNKLA
ncbi:uncharacterized protein UV8b_07112 [Ustilaginoidea virens]|uniref:Uncharacterized protein n=1 Tax=Ustilaginoidea virens TaxID=1159556 RepID=A0A8E5HWJ9_USTVR|nr:uncharacterized protein UV8b_07112 [Ustilaginoidea virens]QUC22871.1 hypothetical protein UV8b_07112 [Ustilaginoidea virens]